MDCRKFFIYRSNTEEAMKIKRLAVCLFSVAAFIFQVGCKATVTESEAYAKPIIGVTIQPQYEFVKSVCGDRFEVAVAVPAGASPEAYEPTPREIEKLEKAVLYFSIGVPAEESGIMPNLSSKTEITKLHTEVKKVYPELTDEGGRDPHIWLSPKRVKLMVDCIAKVVCEADSENAAEYKANAESYKASLETLDNEITDILSNKASDSFIVYHPSFGYFADDYGLKMYSLEEHGREATAKHLAETADFAEKSGIKTIFYQTDASQKQPAAFAEEIGGKAVALDPLAQNYTDNMKIIAKRIAEALK